LRDKITSSAPGLALSVQGDGGLLAGEDVALEDDLAEAAQSAD
jgi:hypothetical protein